MYRPVHTRRSKLTGVAIGYRPIGVYTTIIWPVYARIIFYVSRMHAWPLRRLDLQCRSMCMHVCRSESYIRGVIELLFTMYCRYRHIRVETEFHMFCSEFSHDLSWNGNIDRLFLTF